MSEFMLTRFAGDLAVRLGSKETVVADVALRAMQVLARVARHGRDATLSAEHLDAVARGVEHVVRRTGETVDSEAIGELEGSLIGHAVAGTTPADRRWPSPWRVRPRRTDCLTCSVLNRNQPNTCTRPAGLHQHLDNFTA